MNPLPCIVCGVQLESAVVYENPTYESAVNQPYKGTAFISHGHYGSTVWDPCTGEDLFIEITICDECLTKKKDDVLLASRNVKEVTSYRPWNPCKECVDPIDFDPEDFDPEQFMSPGSKGTPGE